eukprot:6178652-Pleurochrysis_carterae.AAC.10
MEGATGNLVLTLTTIRKVFSDLEAREIRRNIELDKSQGRALLPNNWANTIARNRRRRASVSSAAISLVTRQTTKKAPTGPWTKRFMKCRHCSGSHWHRDCPKRHKGRGD